MAADTTITITATRIRPAVRLSELLMQISPLENLESTSENHESMPEIFVATGSEER